MNDIKRSVQPRGTSLPTTGGPPPVSKKTNVKLLKLNANIAGFSFVVNLQFLNGEDKLSKYSSNIISLIEY